MRVPYDEGIANRIGLEPCAGTIVEYRSTCKTPIVHRAGEATTEVKGTSHWWKNTGRRTVVLLSADLFHDKDDPHTM